MKVLMVITSHDQVGNTGRKTGFAPWHGLAAHRPLDVYEEAKKFRAERNGRAIREPHEMMAFGD